MKVISEKSAGLKDHEKTVDLSTKLTQGQENSQLRRLRLLMRMLDLHGSPGLQAMKTCGVAGYTRVHNATNKAVCLYAGLRKNFVSSKVPNYDDPEGFMRREIAAWEKRAP